MNSLESYPPITIGFWDGTIKTFHGRPAWALRNLICAGEKGCTPIDTPGPRWSHYVWVLRGEGVSIETITERHCGQFPGTHARYVLRSEVVIIENAAA